MLGHSKREYNMSIIQSSEAKLLQAGIKHNELVQELLSLPENKPLADVINLLREEMKMLREDPVFNRGRPNQWNPLG